MSDALKKLRKLNNKTNALINELYAEEGKREFDEKHAARKHSVYLWTESSSSLYTSALFGGGGPTTVNFEREADARAFYATASSRLGKTGVIELSDTSSIPANKVTHVAIDINPERD